MVAIDATLLKFGETFQGVIAGSMHVTIFTINSKNNPMNPINAILLTFEIILIGKSNNTIMAPLKTVSVTANVQVLLISF